MKLVAISCHWADWIKGAGGTIAKYVERGHTATAINIVYPYHSYTDEEEESTKASDRACKILGVDVKYIRGF